MTIEQTDKVDFISTDRDGNTKLTISDHLEWDEELEHLYFLQEKINKYLSFIENGEIYEHRKEAKENDIVINVVCKYKPNNSAENSCKNVRQ